MADYDSGWISCNANQTFFLNHARGVFPHFALVEVAENSDGSGWRVPTMSSSNYASTSWRQTAIVALDPNNVTLRTQTLLFDTRVNEAGLQVAPTSGFCRVRLFDWTPDYDSGWVPISTAAGDRDHSFQHDLGQMPSLQMLYVAENSDGSGWCLPAMGAYHLAYSYGVGMYNTTKQWATVKGGGERGCKFRRRRRRIAESNQRLHPLHGVALNAVVRLT